MRFQIFAALWAALVVMVSLPGSAQPMTPKSAPTPNGQSAAYQPAPTPTPQVVPVYVTERHYYSTTRVVEKTAGGYAQRAASAIEGVVTDGSQLFGPANRVRDLQALLQYRTPSGAAKPLARQVGNQFVPTGTDEERASALANLDSHSGLALADFRASASRQLIAQKAINSNNEWRMGLIEGQAEKNRQAIGQLEADAADRDGTDASQNRVIGGLKRRLDANNGQLKAVWSHLHWHDWWLGVAISLIVILAAGLVLVWLAVQPSSAIPQNQFQAWGIVSLVIVAGLLIWLVI